MLFWIQLHFEQHWITIHKLGDILMLLQKIEWQFLFGDRWCWWSLHDPVWAVQAEKEDGWSVWMADQDANIPTILLIKIEQDPHVNVMSMTTKSQRWINLKHLTAMIVQKLEASTIVLLGNQLSMKVSRYLPSLKIPATHLQKFGNSWISNTSYGAHSWSTVV